MNDSRQAAYGRGSVLSGWLVMLVYAVHGAATIFMPRAEKTSALREALRGWHYLLGLVLFGLLAWRLWCWLQERRPAAPSGLSAAAHGWTRLLAASVYGVMLLMPLLGITQAWTDGLTVHLGPFVTLPALVPVSRVGWMFSGYFHSALSFAVILLTLTAALTGAYLWVRRGVGLLRAFPPGFGAQVFVSLLTTTYAFSTFKEEPGAGQRAIGSYLLVTFVLWAIGAVFARRRRVPMTLGAGAPAGLLPRAAGALVVAALLAMSSYGPYAMFRVSPWPMGEVVAAAPTVNSHEKPIVQVTVAPETALEQQVRTDVYKWCRFCHTVEMGERPLAGPNLYAIFGQQAGTVPNFYYSPAMAEAGRKGLVWTDETLDRFLAGPDEFVPGTSMKISIGPIRDPAVRAALINILKKETMPGAH